MSKQKLKLAFTVVLVIIAVYLKLKDSTKPSDGTQRTENGELVSQEDERQGKFSHPHRRTGLWDHQGSDGLSWVQSARQREGQRRMDAGLPGLQPQTPPRDGGKCDERSGRLEIGCHGQKTLWNLTGKRLAW